MNRIDSKLDHLDPFFNLLPRVNPGSRLKFKFSFPIRIFLFRILIIICISNAETRRSDEFSKTSDLKIVSDLEYVKIDFEFDIQQSGKS